VAAIDEEPITPGPGRHDGVATCRLCASTDAAADHAWCAASGGLVCDECCRRILFGDLRRLGPSVMAEPHGERGEAVIASCVGCERGQRWYAEQLHLSFSDGSQPC